MNRALKVAAVAVAVAVTWVMLTDVSEAGRRHRRGCCNDASYGWNSGCGSVSYGCTTGCGGYAAAPAQSGCCAAPAMGQQQAHYGAQGQMPPPPTFQGGQAHQNPPPAPQHQPAQPNQPQGAP